MKTTVLPLLLICGFAGFAATAACAAQKQLQLIDGFPAGYAVDGNLSEWKTPPCLPAGTGGSLWAAISAQGLLLAGSITGTSAEGIEVWLSCKEAKMPAIGYGNQFGNRWLSSDEQGECFKGDEIDGRELSQRDKAWVELQKRRRTLLKHAFKRHFVITPSGIQEDFWAPAAKTVIAGDMDQYRDEVTTMTYAFLGASTAPLQNAAYAFQKNGSGYTFEAFIPAETFPATNEFPLASMGLSVQPAAGDKSPEPGRVTWTYLPRPLYFLDPHAFIRSVVKWSPSFFYFPCGSPRSVYSFENGNYGYQYEPVKPSPEVITLSLPQTPLFEHKDIQVFEVPVAVPECGRPRYALVAWRNGSVLSTYECHGRCGFGLEHNVETPQKPLVILRRDDSLHVLLQRDDTRSMFGSGQGGGEPAVCFEVIELKNTGTLRHLFNDEFASDYNVEKLAGKGKYGFGFTGDQACWVEEGGQQRIGHFMVTRWYYWDAHSFNYLWDEIKEKQKYDDTHYME